MEILYKNIEKAFPAAQTRCCYEVYCHYCYCYNCYFTGAGLPNGLNYFEQRQVFSSAVIGLQAHENTPLLHTAHTHKEKRKREMMGIVDGVSSRNRRYGFMLSV